MKYMHLNHTSCFFDVRKVSWPRHSTVPTPDIIKRAPGESDLEMVVSSALLEVPKAINQERGSPILLITSICCSVDSILLHVVYLLIVVL